MADLDPWSEESKEFDLSTEEGRRAAREAWLVFLPEDVRAVAERLPPLCRVRSISANVAVPCLGQLATLVGYGRSGGKPTVFVDGPTASGELVRAEESPEGLEVDAFGEADGVVLDRGWVRGVLEGAS